MRSELISVTFKNKIIDFIANESSSSEFFNELAQSLHIEISKGKTLADAREIARFFIEDYMDLYISQPMSNRSVDLLFAFCDMLGDASLFEVVKLVYPKLQSDKMGHVSKRMINLWSVTFSSIKHDAEKDKKSIAMFKKLIALPVSDERAGAGECRVFDLFNCWYQYHGIIGASDDNFCRPFIMMRLEGSAARAEKLLRWVLAKDSEVYNPFIKLLLSFKANLKTSLKLDDDEFFKRYSLSDDKFWFDMLVKVRTPSLYQSFKKDFDRLFSAEISVNAPFWREFSVKWLRTIAYRGNSDERLKLKMGLLKEFFEDFLVSNKMPQAELILVDLIGDLPDRCAHDVVVDVLNKYKGDKVSVSKSFHDSIFNLATYVNFDPSINDRFKEIFLPVEQQPHQYSVYYKHLYYHFEFAMLSDRTNEIGFQMLSANMLRLNQADKFLAWVYRIKPAGYEELIVRLKKLNEKCWESACNKAMAAASKQQPSHAYQSIAWENIAFEKVMEMLFSEDIHDSDTVIAKLSDGQSEHFTERFLKWYFSEGLSIAKKDHSVLKWNGCVYKMTQSTSDMLSVHVFMHFRKNMVELKSFMKYIISQESPVVSDLFSSWVARLNHVKQKDDKLEDAFHVLSVVYWMVMQVQYEDFKNHERRDKSIVDLLSSDSDEIYKSVSIMREATIPEEDILSVLYSAYQSKRMKADKIQKIVKISDLRMFEYLIKLSVDKKRTAEVMKDAFLLGATLIDVFSSANQKNIPPAVVKEVMIQLAARDMWKDASYLEQSHLLANVSEYEYATFSAKLPVSESLIRYSRENIKIAFPAVIKHNALMRSVFVADMAPEKLLVDAESKSELNILFSHIHYDLKRFMQCFALMKPDLRQAVLTSKSSCKTVLLSRLDNNTYADCKTHDEQHAYLTMCWESGFWRDLIDKDNVDRIFKEGIDQNIFNVSQVAAVCGKNSAIKKLCLYKNDLDKSVEESAMKTGLFGKFSKQFEAFFKGDIPDAASFWHDVAKFIVEEADNCPNIIATHLLYLEHIKGYIAMYKEHPFSVQRAAFLLDLTNLTSIDFVLPIINESNIDPKWISKGMIARWDDCLRREITLGLNANLQTKLPKPAESSPVEPGPNTLGMLAKYMNYISISNANAENCRKGLEWFEAHPDHADSFVTWLWGMENEKRKPILQKLTQANRSFWDEIVRGMLSKTLPKTVSTPSAERLQEANKDTDDTLDLLFNKERANERVGFDAQALKIKLESNAHFCEIFMPHFVARVTDDLAQFPTDKNIDDAIMAVLHALSFSPKKSIFMPTLNTIANTSRVRDEFANYVLSVQDHLEYYDKAWDAVNHFPVKDQAIENAHQSLRIIYWSVFQYNADEHNDPEPRDGFIHALMFSGHIQLELDAALAAEVPRNILAEQLAIGFAFGFNVQHGHVNPNRLKDIDVSLHKDILAFLRCSAWSDMNVSRKIKGLKVLGATPQDMIYSIFTLRESASKWKASSEDLALLMPDVVASWGKMSWSDKAQFLRSVEPDALLTLSIYKEKLENGKDTFFAKCRKHLPEIADVLLLHPKLMPLVLTEQAPVADIILPLLVHESCPKLYFLRCYDNASDAGKKTIFLPAKSDNKLMSKVMLNFVNDNFFSTLTNENKLALIRMCKQQQLLTQLKVSHHIRQLLTFGCDNKLFSIHCLRTMNLSTPNRKAANELMEMLRATPQPKPEPKEIETARTLIALQCVVPPQIQSIQATPDVSLSDGAAVAPDRPCSDDLPPVDKVITRPRTVIARPTTRNELENRFDSTMRSWAPIVPIDPVAVRVSQAFFAWSPFPTARVQEDGDKAERVAKPSGK